MSPSELLGTVAAVGGPMSGFAGDVGQGLGTVAGIGGLLGTSGASGRLSGSVVHARLDTLQFAVNPQSMKINKSSGTSGNRTPLVPSDFQESVRSSAPMTISLSGIHLMGPKTLTDALALMKLATPAPKTASATGTDTAAATMGAVGSASAPIGGAAAVTLAPSSVAPSTGTKEDYVLPVVDFSWGTQLALKVTVSWVEINITRFSGQGVPISAEASVTMLEWVTFAPLTNPTSGGLPGRAMHTVVAGDNIVEIAVRTYGDPSAWRAIAVANGLDDPLRVDPGRELYLPGPGELSDVLAADGDVFRGNGA